MILQPVMHVWDFFSLFTDQIWNLFFQMYVKVDCEKNRCMLHVSEWIFICIKYI